MQLMPIYTLDGPGSHNSVQIPLKPELGNYQGQDKTFDDVTGQKDQSPGLNSQAYCIRFFQHQVHIGCKIGDADAIDNKCTCKRAHEYQTRGQGLIPNNTPNCQRCYYKTYKIPKRRLHEICKSTTS